MASAADLAAITENMNKTLVAGELGPSVAGNLASAGIPATTTQTFYSYFKYSGTAFKNFFTKTIPSIFQKPRTPMKLLIMGIIFLLIIFLCYWLYNTVNNYEPFANPNDRLAQIKLIMNKVQAEGFQLARQPLLSQINTITAPPPTKLTTTASPTTPQGPVVNLFNIQPLTFKQAAFLGPVEAGYFDANNGILNQLNLGNRVFFLQIDYVEKTSDKFCKAYEPCLIYRDKNGSLTSKNSASIADVCKYIVEYGFNNVIPNNSNPITLFLHFVRLPYAPTDSDNYVGYLSKVSAMLENLNSNLLTGGYYRAAKENELFSTDYASLKQSIIIGTNIDTSVFMKVKADQPDDLDYKIHFHYFVIDSETVDITTTIPQSNKYNALIFNSATVLSISQTKWAKYKNYFTIVKPPNDKNLTVEQVTTLLNDYGVNVILYDYFSTDTTSTKAVLNLYGSSFRTKPLLLQI